MQTSSAGKLVSDWDPLKVMARDRNPTRECLRRIRKDLREAFSDPVPGIFIAPDDDCVTTVHALIVGPQDTPYEGGFFYFLVDFDDDYPLRSPRVRLQTTGGGTVRFNPNLYANGKVCLSILGTWHGPGWLPVHTLTSVLLSVQSLMNERPLTNEPGFENPRSAQDVEDYNDAIRHETIRVAVLDMVGDTPTHAALPEPFKRLVRELFVDNYVYYMMTVEAEEASDGTPMRDPFGADRGHHRWAQMKEGLTSLKVQVEQALGVVISDSLDESSEDEDEDEDADEDEDEDEKGEE